jgi:predicted phage terminase large subunit-like protein
MEQDIEKLLEEGKGKEITDENLYFYITRSDIFNTVKENGEYGLEHLKTIPLVQEVRRRCEQDLWFLGKYFLWDTDVFGVGKPISENFFCEHVHRRVCDMFVKKDKTKPIGQQDWRKDRLILYPRGTGKSAWDRYDVVQWILNFPDIRILYLTATLPLGEGFVGETKGHFIINEDEPSLMNIYFPEFCFEAKDSGPASRLTCPCALWVRKGLDRKEPTVRADAIDATGTGGHYEVIKADDSVSEQNSNNDVQCKKISTGYSQKHKTLVPTGYADKIGTRYADEDMYGEDIQKNIGKITRQVGDNWEIIDNEETGLRILIGKSIVIKPEVRAKLEAENRPITYAEAGKDGCTLLFPELHTYEWCLYEYNKNEKIFEGQQNQNPRSATNIVFDRPLMLRHTIPFNDPIVPTSGPICQFWDFAYSTEKGRDWTTGSCMIWNPKNQAIVIDMIRSKFKPAALAKAVVDFAVKYKPFIIGVEKSAGAEFLGLAIQQEAYKTKIPEIIDICSRIDWVKPDQGKDAKQTRIKALHPWLTNDMLYFVAHLLGGNIEVLYDEFERCTGKHHHEDIPDVISYQIRYAPKMVQIVQQQILTNYSRSDGNWQTVFDATGELYGESAGHYMPSPFKGYVLRHNPDTFQIELVSDEIQNPIVQVSVEPEPDYRNEHGLDAILGAL